MDQRNDHTRAPPHGSEEARLATLRSYGILNTPAEASFDDITRIASYVCQTPVALVSLVARDHQWFKSAVGTDLRETSMEQSICAHALLGSNYLEIPDTREDPRTARNPLITGEPHVRFYAGAVMRTPDGLPLGTVCVLDTKPRQLTPEQREVLGALARQVMSQMELRRALLISDRLQRNVTRLMAVAGHDLKQPLQVMIMAIDRIRGKLADPRDQRRLSYAIDAGMRMAEELDRLAETSSLQTDLGMPRLSTFSVNDIFASIESTWRMHAEVKNLTLRVLPCHERIVSDPAMLRAILGNLVGNAIKYTRAGRVLLGARRRGVALSLEVLDTGPGIAADQQSAIFDAFHQVDPGSEGLGLGLSIVRRTAEALGHAVSVKSDLRRGSHFSVLVPRAPASAP